LKVLFVCIGNSARSQIAKAFFNFFTKSEMADSAGTEPAQKVSKKAVKVMQEIGIDISKEKPKPLTREMVSRAVRIITMGCLSQDSCPAFLYSSEKIDNWELPDPKGKDIDEFRRLRDEISYRVIELIKEV